LVRAARWLKRQTSLRPVRLAGAASYDAGGVAWQAAGHRFIQMAARCRTMMPNRSVGTPIRNEPSAIVDQVMHWRRVGWRALRLSSGRGSASGR